jgi:4'-phosphopantetheinyl transferase
VLQLILHALCRQDAATVEADNYTLLLGMACTVSILLNPTDVHLWYRATGSLDDAAVNAALRLLSKEERSRCDRFVFTHDRWDFAAAHALLRCVLSNYEDVPPTDWSFEVTDRGKPFLRASRGGMPPLAFNLSHTRGLVACGVGRESDIGVDVEGLDRAPDDLDIAGRYFSPVEYAMLASMPQRDRPGRFVELWTLKEAYIKATGRGLGAMLNEFGFEFAGERDLHFTARQGVPEGMWAFALFNPSPRARMAVAIRSGEPARLRIIAREHDGSCGGALLEPSRVSQSWR